MARQTLDHPSAPSPDQMPLAETGPTEAPVPNGAAVAAILAAGLVVLYVTFR